VHPPVELEDPAAVELVLLHLPRVLVVPLLPAPPHHTATPPNPLSIRFWFYDTIYNTIYNTIVPGPSDCRPLRCRPSDTLSQPISTAFPPSPHPQGTPGEAKRRQEQVGGELTAGGQRA